MSTTVTATSTTERDTHMGTSFVIGAAELAEITGWAARAIPAHPVSPVFAGLLFTAAADPDGGEGLLRVQGYDSDVAVSATVPALVTTPGTLLVSGQLMNRISAALAGGRRPAQLTVTDESTIARITAGRSEWTLPLMDVAEYPPLPELGPAVGMADSATLTRALARVLPAIGRDPGVPMLSAAKLESNGDELTLATTDRYRIASATLPWVGKDENSPPLDVLLPASLLDLATRAFGGGEQVGVHTGAGIGFSTETRAVIGRPLGMEFLPWRKRMIFDAEHYVTLDTAELGYALDQALALGEHLVTLSFVEGEVEISSTGDVGTARALSPVQALVGDPLKIMVNAQYLRDGLTVCETPQVQLHLGDDTYKPIMLRPVGDDTFAYLTIPLRGL